MTFASYLPTLPVFSTPLLKSLKVATGVTAFQFELLVDTVIVDMLATDHLVFV